jgi:hypothetical protein
MRDVKFNNKIHGYGLPRSSRDIEGMKKTERLVARLFDMGTNITHFDIASDVGVHTRPGVVPRDQSLSSCTTGMSSNNRVMA